jgi:hypothetical protein
LGRSPRSSNLQPMRKPQAENCAHFVSSKLPMPFTGVPEYPVSPDRRLRNTVPIFLARKDKALFFLVRKSFLARNAQRTDRRSTKLSTTQRPTRFTLFGVQLLCVAATVSLPFVEVRYPDDGNAVVWHDLIGRHDTGDGPVLRAKVGVVRCLQFAVQVSDPHR